MKLVKSFTKMYKCTENNCDKVYTTKKSLEHHKRFVHCNESAKKCTSCGKVFASAPSAKRHSQNCAIENSKVWVPSCEINTNKNEFDRHQHIATTLTPESEVKLDLFRAWLESGGLGFRRIFAGLRSLWALGWRVTYLNILCLQVTI